MTRGTPPRVTKECSTHTMPQRGARYAEKRRSLPKERQERSWTEWTAALTLNIACNEPMGAKCIS